MNSAHLAELVARVSAAAETSIVGLGVLARCAPDSAEGRLAADLAEELRGVFSTARFVGNALGIAESPTARRSTCERLRWEWVASTGALLDGDPRRRLAAECGSALARAAAASSRMATLVAAAESAAPYVHATAHLERRVRSAQARLEGARADGARAMSSLAS